MRLISPALWRSLSKVYCSLFPTQDDASQATGYNIKMQAGDILVAGSDGLWDNVFDAELASLLPKAPGQVRSSTAPRMLV